MITRIIDWLDHRAGVRSLVGMMLLEGVPGGAKWRYVWGSTLAFVFSIQLITGILLMTAYSPSASQAWNSVHSIQYKMDFGWLIRGLHHFGSQTMMILIGLHMLQVVIAGAHLPPRELNWWLGMGLLGVTFGLSLTGYLLPWDQKGYWATRVATNISSNIPVLGEDIKQLSVGGPDYGNYTLTRFYALHVAILPLTLILMVIAHIYIFRRHGVTNKANVEGLVNKPENEHAAEQFWPRQAFNDMIACMVVFSIMLGLVLWGFSHKVDAPPREDGAEPGFYDHWAKAGQRGLGAELDAAADRDTANYPARPEWYFLFLFQLLKYFPGDQILIGTVFIPNGVMVLLTILPLLGYGPMRKIGHFFGMLVMMTLLILVGILTLLALRDDSPDGILWGMVKHTDPAELEKAETFQHSVHEAEILAKRACQLAMAGTPVEGGHVLMRNDPFTSGQKLFQQKCGSCHGFTAQEGDKFVRTVSFELKLQPHLEKGAADEIRKSLLEKAIPLSKKIDIKSIRDGEEWRIDDADYARSYTVARVRSKLELSTKSMTDGIQASDLGDFGTAKSVKGILKNSMDNHYFGFVKKKDAKGKIIEEEPLTGMKNWRGLMLLKRQDLKWNEKQIAEHEKELDLIAEWVADQRNPRDKRDAKIDFQAAQKAFFSKTINRCFICHSIETKEMNAGKWNFASVGGDSAPDLTNYGSAEWIRAMIMRPGHKTRYDEKNLMPAFRNLDGPGSELFKLEFKETNPLTPDNMIQHLSDIERELIIRWMLRDYRPIYGGAGIAK